MSKYVLLDMTYYTESTREPSSSDRWDRGDTSTNWTFESAKLINTHDYGSYPVSDNITQGDKVYLVVPVWSTADSFGYDQDACAELFGVHETREQAEAHKASLEAGDARGHGYLPWSGYFESLSYIKILERYV